MNATRRTAAVFAVIALAVPAAAQAGKAEAPAQRVLVGLLLPFTSGQDMRMDAQVRVSGGTSVVTGTIRSNGSGRKFTLAASRRSCGSLRQDEDAPLRIVSRIASIHAEKNQDIEVESDETDFAGARSLVLLDDGGTVHSCGAALRGRTGTVSHATGDASVLAATATRKGRTRVRALIECETARQCRRLLEEEGIFYFARNPCGPLERRGTVTELDQDLNSVRSGARIVLQDVLVSSLRGVRSARLRLGDDELACGAASPAAASAAKVDGRPKVAMLLPYSEQAPVLVVGIEPRGETARMSAYGTGLEPGRYSWGVTQTATCKSSPELLGSRFGRFRAKDEDVAVENDETHWVGHDRARAVVLFRRENGRAVAVACGRLARSGGGVTRLSGANHTALAALGRSRNGLRLRVAVDCARRGDCRRLMEEEGIFYFARQPCGKSADAGDERFTVTPRASSQTGDGQLLGNLVFSAPRAPAGARSLRLELDGEQLACGALG
jgi:hypothetical protein